MDYSKMLDFHKKNNADATIAVIKVPKEEASRFGIMNTNDDMSIYEFEEKPKNPKSTLASMGIYIFNWKTLKKYLKEDELDKLSSNDFGKNIIPKMIDSNKKMFAYAFEGYWKDVGTIDSLWEANMDLISKGNGLNLYDEEWRIYSVNHSSPAQYIGVNAKVKNSLVVEGCHIEGEVNNSVIFQGVNIGKNSVVTDSVIMPNVTIGDNVTINKAIIGTGASVEGDSIVGNGDEIKVIGAKEKVMAGSNVEVCTTI